MSVFKRDLKRKLKWKYIKRLVHREYNPEILNALYDLSIFEIINTYESHNSHSIMVSFYALWLRAILTHPAFGVWYQEFGIRVVCSTWSSKVRIHVSKNEIYLYLAYRGTMKALRKYAPEYVLGDIRKLINAGPPAIFYDTIKAKNFRRYLLFAKEK